jgi:hypothetical protein
MDDIKIPTSTGDAPIIDGVSEVDSSIESAERAAEVDETAAAALDPVEQIARDVACGKIGRDEAVEQLLANVLDSKMVQAAPKALRQGLKETLETLLETDPHLGSLMAAIGPREVE